MHLSVRRVVHAERFIDRRLCLFGRILMHVENDIDYETTSFYVFFRTQNAVMRLSKKVTERNLENKKKSKIENVIY